MTTSHNAPVDIEHAMPLAEMSVAQIAALPPDQLQEAHTNLLTLQSLFKGVLDRFHAALDQRYAEQTVVTRQANGRDFGVCHLTDGPLRITVDVPKKVVWDQAQLAEIAQRIAAAGDKVGDYIDTDYSIPESRFNAWPSTLKETFAKARTVQPGKTSYRLAIVDSEGGV
jgi:hypothetical protein